MSKYDDFWDDIAPMPKEGGEVVPGATNTNADLETALTKANNEIENLKKMISELKPKDEQSEENNEKPSEEKGETENE